MAARTPKKPATPTPRSPKASKASKKPVAPKPPESQDTQTHRTRTATAGEPTTAESTLTRGARSRPSDAELDLRDRMKVGPRRPAGPPLTGDTPEPMPTRGLSREELTPPTDPK